MRDARGADTYIGHEEIVNRSRRFDTFCRTDMVDLFSSLARRSSYAKLFGIIHFFENKPSECKTRAFSSCVTTLSAHNISPESVLEFLETDMLLTHTHTHDPA